MTGDNRRDVLFENWTEEEFRDRLTTTDVRRANRVTSATGTTNVLSMGVASGDQLRILGYKLYAEGGGSERVRFEGKHSTTGFSSIIEHDYFDSTGQQDHRGNGFSDPYTTVNFHADGSIEWDVVVETSGGDATLDSAAVTLEAAKISRLDESRL